MLNSFVRIRQSVMEYRATHSLSGHRIFEESRFIEDGHSEGSDQNRRPICKVEARENHKHTVTGT